MKRTQTWLLISIFFLTIFGIWQWVSHHFAEQEKSVRTQVRQAVTDTFPEQAEDYARTLGIRAYPADESVSRPLPAHPAAAVLIHGLDDPGKVWMNLAPELALHGFAVYVMSYPNDQPITESTRLFFRELSTLRTQGVERISIVAHSMGGLVTRDLLTDPAIDYPHQADEGLVPVVDQFIMVGTPNHGSQIARFRAFSEVRDQLDRLTKGQMNGLGFIFDGAGEAKLDLLPGSSFLTSLNRRPHPADVDMLIIAGIAAPWTEDDVSNWLKGVEESRGTGQGSTAERLEQFILSVSEGLGDGLVTVQSTRLPGIEHRTVRGTHLSMIRNLTEGSERIPPAVPIIVEQLQPALSE